jgi:hypothetical protein
MEEEIRSDTITLGTHGTGSSEKLKELIKFWESERKKLISTTKL